MRNLTTYSITVFGDSVPKGVYIENGNIKHTAVNAINLINEAYGINIVNNSLFGQTLNRLHKKAELSRYLDNLDNAKKNVVVISLGGNESDYDWCEVAKDPKAVHFSKTDVVEYEQILSQFVVDAKSKGVEVVLATILPVDSDRYFHNVISNNCDGTAVKQWLQNDLSNISRHQEMFNNAILRVATKHNCYVIDIRNEFLSKINFLNYLCNDGAHPNELGQALIANIITTFIETVDKTKSLSLSI